jgi:hypothetical protein
MQVVRELVTTNTGSIMNAGDILKKLAKTHLASMKVDKDELMEIFNYYKELNIIYLDQDENVVFL